MPPRTPAPSPADLLAALQPLATAERPEDVWQRLLRAAVDLVGADHGVAMAWDEPHGELLATCSIGLQRQRETRARARPGEGVVGLAVESRRAVRAASDTLPGAPNRTAEWTTMAVPVTFGDEVLGALGLARAAGHPYGPDEEMVLEILALAGAGQLAAVTANRLREAWAELRSAQHRLNNELGVALGLAELLAEDSDSLPAASISTLDDIVGALEEALRTVEHLRRVRQSVEGGAPVEPPPTI